MTWTPELDAELRRIYAIAHYGRKVEALRRFASTLRITSRHCSQRAVILGIARCRTRWTDTELANVRHYVSTHPPRSIARILGRSERAVRHQIRIARLNGITWDQGYSVHLLADFMGTKPETLAKILEKWPMERNNRQRFSSCDVQLWLWEHLDDFDLRPMDQAWLKKMLKEAAA